MAATLPEVFDRVVAHARETSLLGSISSVLGWDERTQMPAAGGKHRADQMTLLSGLIHQRLTDPNYGEWLETLAAADDGADPHSDRATIVRELKRAYDRRVKLPQSLVEALTRAAVEGQQAWESARKNNDYAAFQPVLQRLLELSREKADALGWKECRYDALLDEFEPQSKASEIGPVLRGLCDELAPLVQAIVDSGRTAPVELLERRYPIDKQREFGVAAATAIGFEFDRGRLDVTAHPFCSEVGPHDVRLTTRYDERFFPSALFGTLHEAGHGIYDQGMRADQYGLPTAHAVSYGIHESQSRMWENQVGRSRAFWTRFFPSVQQAFPESLGDVALDDFYFAINDVRPSLIRVEADEATYNLHILIRFELEQLLIAGDLSLADLPGAWHDKYQQYLGIQSDTDADGVLQDVHWSFGAFGYFPSYSLGNLYSAQFFEQAAADLGDLDAMFAAGEFRPLREWLRVKIHHHGQRYSAAELVQHVTGKPLSHEPLMRHLRGKYEPLYGLK